MGIIAGWVVRLIGGHLVSSFLSRASTGALYTAEHLIVGLGARFFLGMGCALYFTSPTVRAAINGVGKAVVGLVV